MDGSKIAHIAATVAVLVNYDCVSALQHPCHLTDVHVFLSPYN